MVYAAAAWGMGLLITSFLPSSYDLIVILVVLMLFTLMKFLFKFKWKEIFTVLTVFVIASGFYRIYDITVYQKILKYDGNNISFSGKILEIKEYSGNKSSYLVNGKINNNVSVKMTVYADSYNCRINDYIEFTCTVKAFENDYLFNSKDYYKSQGIFLTSDKISSIKFNENNNFSLSRVLSEYKDRVTNFVKINLPEDVSSMLCGMLFGDKTGLSSDDKTLFYRTGIGHIMAVSGLHLVLFCGIFSFIFKKLKLRKVKTFILLESVMILFAVCSGLSKSVLRAALMMTLVYAADLFFRKSNTLNSIAISFIILTVPCPFLIRNPSLILSITGTFCAGVFAPFMTDKIKGDSFIKKHVKYGAYIFFVSLGILPFSVIFFGEGSLFSPIANIFLTPICMAALLPALIASITIFLNPIFLIKFSGFLCRIVLLCVRFIGRLKFSGVNFSDETKYIFGGAVIFCLIVFLIFKNRKYLFGAVTISSAIILSYVSAIKFISSDDIEIAVLGNGKIDVIIVTDRKYTNVIDISGRKNNCRYALKFLQENNIDKVNNIIIKEKPYQAMSVYNSEFSLINSNNVILSEGIYVREGVGICGNYPKYSDFKSVEIPFENGIININDTRISVEYGKFKFVCDSSCRDYETDVYAEYENIFNPPICSAVIVPDYENIDSLKNVITDSNVSVKADKSGRFYLGNL